MVARWNWRARTRPPSACLYPGSPPLFFVQPGGRCRARNAPSVAGNGERRDQDRQRAGADEEGRARRQARDEQTAGSGERLGGAERPRLGRAVTRLHGAHNGDRSVLL